MQERGAVASEAMELTVAAVQMAMAEDVEPNVKTAERLVREAAARGARVVLLPELFEGPYFCKDMLPEHFDRALPIDGHPTVAHFRDLAAELEVVLPLSVYERANRATFNSVVVIDADGAALGTYRKSHIPDGPGYTEKYYFNPGDTGFRVWPTRHGVVGVAICWDQWFPETARVHGPDGRRRAPLPDGDRQRTARSGLGLERALAAGDAGPRRRQPHAARRVRTGWATRSGGRPRSRSTDPRSSPTPPAPRSPRPVGTRRRCSSPRSTSRRAAATGIRGACSATAGPTCTGRCSPSTGRPGRA